MAAISRPASPSLPPTSAEKLPPAYPLSRSTNYRPGPIISPPDKTTRDQASASTGSGLLLLSEVATAPSIHPTAHTSAAPPPRSSPRLCQTSACGPNPSTCPCAQPPFDRPEGLPALANTAVRNSNSPSALPRDISTGKLRSFFPAPINLTGPTCTIPQLGSDKKAFDAPTPGASGQSQYQMMTVEAENGPVEVPINVQAASKVADEKRKRNATASYRFRQRRKERESETSQNISKLEDQI
ncbi:hypothetical protein MMC28_007023 [Mycoblastus sanguinarius]|nr:hypothetical protein [Mycoblastus sanguinarius]